MATGSDAQALNDANMLLLRKQVGNTDLSGAPLAPNPDAAPINDNLKAALTGNTWQERFTNYLNDTDWGNVGLAALKAIPSPKAPGTHYSNEALSGGQVARVPFTAAAGIAGIPAIVSSVKQGVFGGDPLPAAEGSAEAAGAISGFGKSLGETIAGVPLTDDILRGTSDQMAGNIQSTLLGAMLPLPKGLTAPVLGAASRLTKAADDVLTGTNLIQKSTSIAAKALETFTPLAISYAPSLKVMGTNAAVQGMMAPLAEAAFKSLAPAQEAAQQTQDQAAQVASQGTDINTQGVMQAATVSGAVDSVTKPQNVVQAGGIPLFENPTDNLLAAGSIILGGLAGWKYRNVVQRIITGYDPKVRGDTETIVPKLTQVAQQIGKGDASADDFLRKTLRADGSYTANQIDDMVARNKEERAARGGAAVTTREDTWMTDGKFMDSSIKSVPGNDLHLAHDALSDAQKQGFNELAWAKQELNDRDRMIAAQLNRSATNPLYTSVPVRNLEGHTYRDLENIVNTHQADPAIQNVYTMFRDVLDKTGDYMADQKSMHPTEWAKFHTENPYYVPSKGEGQNSFMDPRRPIKTFDPATGVDVPRGVGTFEELGSAIGNLPRYVDEAFRRTEGMKGKRDLLELAERAIASGNSYLTKAFPQLGGKTILGRSGRLGSEAAERSVTWRDSNGMKRTTEVNDIVLRDALNGMGNPSMLQLQNGIIGKMTKYYESGAVGPLSLFDSTMFAPKSALYAMTIGSIVPTERGIAKGYLDRLAQDTFGIRLPGDISGIAGLPWHAAKNIAELLADRGARALHNTVMTDGILTKVFDKNSLEAASQKMANWYKTTHSYAMREAGVAGPSSQNVIDTSKMYTGNPAGALTRSKGFWGGVEGTHDFVNDIMRAIATSPSGVMKAVNPNVEPWRLASSIRNLSGDPGRSGAYRNARLLAQGVNATPWGNVYLQAIGKMMEAGTSVDKALYSLQGAVTLGAGVAMASQWNASLGQDYVQHQFFERSPDDVAQNVYIGIPGLPPSMGLKVPVDPGVRPIMLAAQALHGLHTGLFDGTLFKPENEAERLMYSEMVHHKYGPPVEGSVARSVLQQFLIPPMPGIVESGLALAGVQARGYGDTRVPTTRPQQGFAGGTGAMDDNLVNQVVPGLAEHVIRGIGAGLGDFAYKFYAGLHRDLDPHASDINNETKTWGQALHTQLLESGQRAKDSTSELGSYPLLNGFDKYVPSQEAASLAVKDKINNIKDIAERMSAVTEQGGPRDMIGNKKIGHQEYAGTKPAQPGDIDTGALAQDIQELYKRLSPTVQNIKAEYSQYTGLANSNRYEPREKRGMQEYFGRQITDYNRRLLMDIQRAEEILSNKYGQKIDFSNKQNNLNNLLSKQ